MIWHVVLNHPNVNVIHLSSLPEMYNEREKTRGKNKTIQKEGTKIEEKQTGNGRQQIVTKNGKKR